MADRYGRPSAARRRVVIGVSGLVGVVALAWVIWAAYVQGTPEVQSSLRTYHVVDDHTARATVVVKTRNDGRPRQLRGARRRGRPLRGRRGHVRGHRRGRKPRPTR